MRKEKILLKINKYKKISLITGIIHSGIPISIQYKINNHKIYKTIFKLGKKHHYLFLIMDNQKGYLNLGFEDKSKLINHSIGIFSLKNRTLIFHKIHKNFIVVHHKPYSKKTSVVKQDELKKSNSIDVPQKKISYYFINHKEKKLNKKSNQENYLNKKSNDTMINEKKYPIEIHNSLFYNLSPHSQLNAINIIDVYPFKRLFNPRMFKTLKYRVFLYSIQSSGSFSIKLKHSFGSFFTYILKSVLHVSKSDLPKFTRLLMMLHFMIGIYQKQERGIQYYFNFCNKKIQMFLRETYLRRNPYTKRYELGLSEKTYLILSICTTLIHLGKGGISCKAVYKIAKDLEISVSQIKKYFHQLGCHQDGFYFRLV